LRLRRSEHDLAGDRQGVEEHRDGVALFARKADADLAPAVAVLGADDSADRVVGTLTLMGLPSFLAVW
jgi:hypothetical protein